MYGLPENNFRGLQISRGIFIYEFDVKAPLKATRGLRIDFRARLTC